MQVGDVSSANVGCSGPERFGGSFERNGLVLYLVMIFGLGCNYFGMVLQMYVATDFSHFPLIVGSYTTVSRNLFENHSSVNPIF